jgi:hypothetical protein
MPEATRKPAHWQGGIIAQAIMSSPDKLLWRSVTTPGNDTSTALISMKQVFVFRNRTNINIARAYGLRGHARPLAASKKEASRNLVTVASDASSSLITVAIAAIPRTM